MNATTVTTGTSTSAHHTDTRTINAKSYKIEMIDDGQLSMGSDDDDDDMDSSDGSMFDDSDLAHMAVQDDVAHQLAAAGPVGVAAAAAISSSKKRKRAHSFETNPSVRKRQQNRLLRKLRNIIFEFTGRVGKQAVVLVATPGKPNTSYKVFGAKPLEDVVRNLKNIVMDELENALAQQAPPPPQEDPTLFELPPLIIDGIPTPVEKMTQAQLRAFIPLMLKYSTGRGKPGWGRESTRPPWWPKELPWANVRMDARSEDDKQKISWTHALRKIVINCYKYHGREDLLPTFADDDEKLCQIISQAGEEDEDDEPITRTLPTVTNSGTSTTNYTTQTVLSTIQNADGTVSLIQVDPNNPIITLPDGTTAQVQGVATLHQGEGGATIQTVQSLSDVNGHENMTVDLTEATVAQDGQIYITAEDGQGYPVSVSNMITVPVSASMYQSMMANIQQIHTNSDGTVCITPMQVHSNNNNNRNANTNNNFQYYTLMATAATSVAGQRLQLMPRSQNQSQNQNQNQVGITNINNNDNNDRNNSNRGTNNNIRCQIFNPSSLNNNSSQQNHQTHNSNQNQNQQQNLNQIQAKVLFASAANLQFNSALATNTNNNNNNVNINNSTNKIANATIFVATPGNFGTAPQLAVTPISTSTSTPNSTPIVTTKRTLQKRRKQSLAKVVPIKIEENANEEFLNLQLLDGANNRNNNNNNSNNNNNNNNINNNNAGEEALPFKSIKLENLDK